MILLIFKVLLGHQHLRLQILRFSLDLRSQILLRIQYLLVHLIHRLMQLPYLLTILLHIGRIPPDIFLEQLDI